MSTAPSTNIKIGIRPVLRFPPKVQRAISSCSGQVGTPTFCQPIGQAATTCCEHPIVDSPMVCRPVGQAAIGSVTCCGGHQAANYPTVCKPVRQTVTCEAACCEPTCSESTHCEHQVADCPTVSQPATNTIPPVVLRNSNPSQDYFKVLFDHEKLSDKTLPKMDWTRILNNAKNKTDLIPNTDSDPRIVGPHIVLKSGERPQIKNDRTRDRPINHWLYFNQTNIHPDMVKLVMISQCSMGSSCRNPYHCLNKIELLSQSSSEEFTESDWTFIKEYILSPMNSIISDDHILWKFSENNDRKQAKFTHKGINKPITHWLHLCETREDPRITKQLKMIRQCDVEDCVNADHHCNQYDEDSIFIINAQKLKKHTIRQGDCLNWTGGYHGLYGQTNFNGKCTTAHKMSYLIHNRIYEVDEGIQIAHSCNNPKCVEITHLREATPKENNADKKLHGTDPSGERNPMAVLTAVQAIEIYQNRTTGTRFLSQKYEVGQQTIRDIRSGRAWSSVTGADRIPVPDVKKRYINNDIPDKFFDIHMKLLRDKTVDVQGDRFDTPCWCSTSLNAHGYGTHRMLGRSFEAHRAAYMVFHRKEIEENLLVRHMCLYKECCNPLHLELGTSEDNARDRIRDNTNKSANRHPEETIENVVRQLYNTPDRPKEIAKSLGVTVNTVRGIINKSCYNDVTRRMIENKEIQDKDLSTKAYKVHNRTLTDEKAAEILRDILINMTNFPQANIASKHGVKPGFIADMNRGQSYGDIKEKVLEEIEKKKELLATKMVPKITLKVPAIIKNHNKPPL